VAVVVLPRGRVRVNVVPFHSGFGDGLRGGNWAAGDGLGFVTGGGLFEAMQGD
jgi:hypothetical protein